MVASVSVGPVEVEIVKPDIESLKMQKMDDPVGASDVVSYTAPGIVINNRGMLFARRMNSIVPKFGLGISQGQLNSYLMSFNSQTYPGQAIAISVVQGTAGRDVHIYLVNTASNSLVYKSKETIGSSGQLPITVTETQASPYKLVVSYVPLTDEMAIKGPVIQTPLWVSTRITFWEVMAKTENISDVWARWQGRAIYRQPLPCLFWRDVGYTVGLAGSSKWRDLVPVFENQTVYYMVGVSAWCNTSNPYPPESECCAARQNTWWQSTIYARNTVENDLQELGSDQINLSYHNTASFTTSGANYLGRCVSPDGCLCGWETGPSCSNY